MNVNPGELRHRVKFVKVINGTDAEGFPIRSESTIYECQAKITQMSGTEKIKSGAEVASSNTRFLIRYTNLINEDLMIKVGSLYYDIKFINDYEFKHEYIEVWTELEKQV